MQKEKTVNELLIELHHENEDLKEKMLEIKEIEDSYTKLRFGYSADELREIIEDFERKACEERRNKHEQNCDKTINK